MTLNVLQWLQNKIKNQNVKSVNLVMPFLKSAKKICNKISKQIAKLDVYVQKSLYHMFAFLVYENFKLEKVVALNLLFHSE